MVGFSPLRGRRYRTEPILYSATDLRRIIRRYERGEHPPSDSIAVTQVRASETRRGRRYQRKAKADSVMNFDSIDLGNLV